jgi:hypothetical protein
MLESYIITKIWDDPDQNVDAMIDEFFRLYFGAAGEPMKKFYLKLEEIATNPKNYPKPYYKRNAIDWKNVAWTTLGTAERMEQLGKLIAQAQSMAKTEQEKERVALWYDGVWKWMVDGRAEYLAKQQEKAAKK